MTKKPFILLFALVLSFIISVTFANYSSASPLLVFTENPSVPSLSVTMSGSQYGTVTLDPNVNAGAQAWLWSPPANISGSPISDILVGQIPISTPIAIVGQISFQTPIAMIGQIPFQTPLVNGAIIDSLIDVHYADGSSATFSVQFLNNGGVTSSVPEPTTMLLLGLGLTGLAGFRRKFKQ